MDSSQMQNCSNESTNAATTLCDVCQWMFQQHQTIPIFQRQHVYHPHHDSPRDVFKASRHGCRLCRRLWGQVVLFQQEQTDKLEAEKYIDEGFTGYSIHPIDDFIDTDWPECGGPIDVLRSTETWYELSIKWQDCPWQSSDLRYYLRESSSAFLPSPHCNANVLTDACSLSGSQP